MIRYIFKQKTAYELRISDWSSDVCSSDLAGILRALSGGRLRPEGHPRQFDLRRSGTHACRRRHLGRARDVLLEPAELPTAPHGNDRGYRRLGFELGSASCRERVRQYV